MLKTLESVQVKSFVKATEGFIVTPLFFSFTSHNNTIPHHAAVSQLQSCSQWRCPVRVSVAKLVALALMRDKARLEGGMEGTGGCRGNRRVHLLRVLVVNNPEDNRGKVSRRLERRKQQTGDAQSASKK